MKTTEDICPLPLYHGTSTLSLDSILETGLGGRNILAEWKVFEFAQALYPLVAQHLAHLDDFCGCADSYRKMVEQRQGQGRAFNYQHGQTYLSPSPFTAIHYVVDKRYGSELLTCTLDFLEELLRRKIPGVADLLYRQYPQVFEKLDISPAPVLIRLDNVAISHLLGEDDSDPQGNIERIRGMMRQFPNKPELMLQQTNFRLRAVIPAKQMEMWLINVARWDRFAPEFTLHRLPGKPDPLPRGTTLRG